MALTSIDVPYDPPDYERYSKEAGLGHGSSTFIVMGDRASFRRDRSGARDRWRRISSGILGEGSGVRVKDS